MEIHASELAGPITCVRLDGRLDSQGADAIALRFTAAVASQSHPAVVDLSQVSFVASMGIRLLISTARSLGMTGGKMVLFGAPPLAQEVFVDAALDQIILIANTEADALDALAGG